RPPVPRFQGARRSLALPAPLLDALGSLGQREETNLFTTLLAAFATLIFRYSGQDGIVVVAPVTARAPNEAARQSNGFAEVLVLHLDLRGGPTFRELLRRVHAVRLNAETNGALPFGLLAEALRPEHDLSHTPLFQIVFAGPGAPVAIRELPGPSLLRLTDASG